MVDNGEGSAPPGIAVLPPTTVRQIGSHQLITDPSSVVKELVDNALDARAKSIFVDITANTVDSIQVKDDGHGIPYEDRAVACRRYCTSKIRDFRDLKELGGKWLGFRGEALASTADMSGTVSITTRVEGEPVAVKLNYQRNGELASTARDSHPIGTTVKATKLLESAKVRRDLAIKGSARCLAKIRRLMQAYALARPAVRFRLHVLKAKNNNGNFVYAPKANANVEDAAFKVIGKECASQCDWTVLEMGDFEVCAFLPKPTAVGSKVANQGAFISIDSRPVSATRGTMKKIAAAVRDRLRKVNSTLSNVRDPFFCMNIICPVDSYDPNVEPAKDDVIFGDGDFILALVGQLLLSYYPENTTSADHTEHSQSEDVVVTQSPQISHVEEPLSRSHTPFSICQDKQIEEPEAPSLAAHSWPLRWRSSMYGVDEEDLEFLQKNTSVAVEEEERCFDAALSNPWTITRMNVPIKSKKSVSNGQLPSPAKSQGGISTAPQSPACEFTPCQSGPVEPLTFQTTSQANIQNDRPDDELQGGSQRLLRPAPPDFAILSHNSSPRLNRVPELPLFRERMFSGFSQPAPQASISVTSFAGTATPRRNPESRQPFNNKPFVPPAPQLKETWFGQPMRNAPKAARPQKGSRQQGLTFFPNDSSFSSQRSLVLPAAERLVETTLLSKDNTDIREFFSNSRRALANAASCVRARDTQPRHISDQLHVYTELESPVRGSARRSQSADPYQCSIAPAREMDTSFQLHQNATQRPPTSQTCRYDPLEIASAARPAPGPRRRRTTDGGLHQTKSSTLPLNFTPNGFRIHTLSLPINIRVLSIAQQARKLDMTANSLEWGYDSRHAFDVFASPISERKIMNWVVSIDNMLQAIFKRVSGVEVRGTLHESIQRLLNTRKGEETEDGDTHRAVVAADRKTPTLADDNINLPIVDASVGLSGPGAVHCEPGALEQAATTRGNIVAIPEQNTATVDANTIDSDGYEEEFDFSLYVDLDGDAGGRSARVPTVKTEDEFRDEIDDEMLMDL